MSGVSSPRIEELRAEIEREEKAIRVRMLEEIRAVVHAEGASPAARNLLHKVETDWTGRGRTCHHTKGPAAVLAARELCALGVVDYLVAYAYVSDYESGEDIDLWAGYAVEEPTGEEAMATFLRERWEESDANDGVGEYDPSRVYPISRYRLVLPAGHRHEDGYTSCGRAMRAEDLVDG